MDMENRVARRMGLNWTQRVGSYRLPVMKWKGHRAVLYNVVTSQWHCGAYLKVSGRVDLESSYQEKKNVTFYSAR